MVKISNNRIVANQAKVMGAAAQSVETGARPVDSLCENIDLLRQVVPTPRKVCYLRLDRNGPRLFRQVQIKTASRLALFPPYLFAELDRLKREVASKGVDVISLSIGDALACDLSFQAVASK